MTMLLTVQARDFIVAGSDMRLSRMQQGKAVPMHELERKVIAVQGGYFKGVVQFCGLARVGGHWTHDWLVEVLDKVHAASLDPSALHRELATQATSAWKVLAAHRSLTPADLRCSIVTAGWCARDGAPVGVHGLVSNFEGLGAPASGDVSPEFKGGLRLFPRDQASPRDCTLLAAGSGSRSKHLATWQRACRAKVAGGASCADVARLIGSIIAEESRNPALHGTVGRDALVVEVPFPGTEMRGAAVDARGQEVVTFFPSLIGEGATFRDVQVWGGPIPTAPDGSPLPPDQWPFQGRPTRR